MTAPNDAVTDEEWSAAGRLAEAVNLHVHVVLAGGRIDRPGFVAIDLEDGRSVDGVLYESRPDGIRHNGSNRATFYVKVGHDSMPRREALFILQMARQAYKNGIVFAEEAVEVPHLPELMMPFIPRTLRAAGVVQPNRADRHREKRSGGGLIIP